MTELDTSVVQYDITDGAIAAMKHEYAGLTITDKDSYEIVKKAIADCRGKRTSVDKRRLELTKKARDYQAEVNSAGKEIIASLLEIEEPLKAMKKVEDDKEAAIEAEKKRIDDERIAAIMAKITSISDLNSPDIINMKSLEINRLRNSLIDLEIKGEDFEEFSEQAERIKANVLGAVQKAYDERLAFEAAAVKAGEEADRLVKEREAQEAREKALAEKEAEIAKKEAEIKAEEERILAEKDEKKRLEVLKKRLEDVKIQAEKDAKEKAEDEIIRQEQYDLEREAEADRQEALKPDKEKLLSFVDKLLDFIDTAPKIEQGELKDVADAAILNLLSVAESIQSDIKDIENL